MEEIKEVELRSRRRGKFIYNRTYNSIGLNQVSHFSQCSHAPSRLYKNVTDEQIKIFVTVNTESDTFCMEEYSEKCTIVV